MSCLYDGDVGNQRLKAVNSVELKPSHHHHPPHLGRLCVNFYLIFLSSINTVLSISLFNGASPKFINAVPLAQVDASKVNKDAKFAALDLDSLDVVEVVLAIEEEFAIEIPDVVFLP